MSPPGGDIINDIVFSFGPVRLCSAHLPLHSSPNASEIEWKMCDRESFCNG